jgi:hypothetical protein
MSHHLTILGKELPVPNMSRRHDEPHNWSGGKKMYLAPDGKEP